MKLIFVIPGKVWAKSKGSKKAHRSLNSARNNINLPSRTMLHDVNAQLANLYKDIERCKENLDEFKAEVKEHGLFTAKFLATCKELGIKVVSIGRKTKKVKSTESWPFGYQGSAFADGNDEEDSWPLIWRAVEVAGISGGCGNSGQRG